MTTNPNPWGAAKASHFHRVNGTMKRIEHANHGDPPRFFAHSHTASNRIPHPPYGFGDERTPGSLGNAQPW